MSKKAHAILTGPARATFLFGSVDRGQSLVMRQRETLALEFDPEDSERLAGMFEALAALIRKVPDAVQEAIDSGAMPRPSDPPPDPMAN